MVARLDAQRDEPRRHCEACRVELRVGEVRPAGGDRDGIRRQHRRCSRTDARLSVVIWQPPEWTERTETLTNGETERTETKRRDPDGQTHSGCSRARRRRALK